MAELAIHRNEPIGDGHPLAQASVMAEVSAEMCPKQEIVPLIKYLQEIAGKPRGTVGGNTDLNSHNEEFIIKDGEIRVASLSELQAILKSAGLDIELLGVQSIGNANQKVEAMVQGVDRTKPTSGYERPTISEGPHMILAPYAVDKEGKLHLFRTIQMRTGEAVIDTPRGFAEKKELDDGQQMYAAIEDNGPKIVGNMQRIVGEESGDALQIKRVTFLGSPKVNSSFVTSKSAVFGVEVDYAAFVTAQKVISAEELQRRREQFEHEGLVGDVLDFTLPDYADYKRDSSLVKDMAADFGTDTVVIDFLERELTSLAQREKHQREILTAEGQANREFKQDDPEGYVEQRLRVSKALHPDKFEANKAKAEAYLQKLYRENLDKAS
jgi:hypothetical protein